VTAVPIPESVEPLAQSFESAGVDRVQATRSLSTSDDQARRLQHLEMLRYRWAADVHPVSKLTDGTRTVPMLNEAGARPCPLLSSVLASAESRNQTDS